MILVYEHTFCGEISHKRQHEIGLLLLEMHFGYLPEIEVCSSGKPYFVSEKLFFNISHSENKVVVVVSSCEVGIDVQRTKTIMPQVMEKKFHPNEIARIKSDDDFSLIWCIKESFGKCCGKGILYNSEVNDFSPLLNSESGNFVGCYFLTRKQEEYVYCLCAEKEDEVIWKDVLEIKKEINLF